jgi:hypothetical protein
VQIGVSSGAPATFVGRAHRWRIRVSASRKIFFTGMAQNGAEVRFTRRACCRMVDLAAIGRAHARFLRMNPDALKQDEHVGPLAPCLQHA